MWFNGSALGHVHGVHGFAVLQSIFDGRCATRNYSRPDRPLDSFRHYLRPDTSVEAISRELQSEFPADGLPRAADRPPVQRPPPNRRHSTETTARKTIRNTRPTTRQAGHGMRWPDTGRLSQQPQPGHVRVLRPCLSWATSLTGAQHTTNNRTSTGAPSISAWEFPARPTSGSNRCRTGRASSSPWMPRWSSASACANTPRPNPSLRDRNPHSQTGE